MGRLSQPGRESSKIASAFAPIKIMNWTLVRGQFRFSDWTVLAVRCCALPGEQHQFRWNKIRWISAAGHRMAAGAVRAGAVASLSDDGGIYQCWIAD
jgi:hypothetical protein